MFSSRPAILSLAVCAAALPIESADATEAVAGRYIPGMFAAPGAGIVPPVPGVYWDFSNAVYHGEASGTIPVGGGVAFDLEATMVISAFAGIYVTDWDLPGNWTYAVQWVLPVGYTEAEAGLGSLDNEDEMAGLGDIQFSPLLFGWHNAAGNTFVSAGLNVTAPTGAWEEGRLAFVGLNYWSFTPSVGFTHITKDGWDFSAKFGVDINTENEATDYYSGAMAHLDLAVTKSLTESFSLGVIAGVLYQIEDDDSTFADTRPDGFKGRSVAVGPLAKYKAKFDDKTEIDFSLSWAPELDVKNRMKGDAVYFHVSGKF
jgi:hypothetical protein